MGLSLGRFISALLLAISTVFPAHAFAISNDANSSSSSTSILDYHYGATILGMTCGSRVRTILENHPGSITLLDINGHPTRNGTNDPLAWGIGYQDCRRICGAGIQAFDYNNFQFQLTSWLLPYLALAAQLPFGARSSWKNLLTILYAIGCPALMIYNLLVTTLYRRWVCRQFREVLTPRKGGHLIPDHFKRKVKAAIYVLLNWHLVPIQILEGPEACLSSAVVLAENTRWWERLKYELSKRRQPLTQSLVAQTVFVVISQAFVWIGALRLSGDKFVGLGLSSGLVFLWMIPVVWGTYEVGNFPQSESFSEAISNCNDNLFLAGDGTRVPTAPRENEKKTAITQRIPLTLGVEPLENSAANSDEEQQVARPEIPSYWIWLPVEGDEVEPGLTMNYARYRTCWVAAMHVFLAFKAAKDKIVAGQIPDASQLPFNGDAEAKERFQGSREQVSAYCTITARDGPFPVFVKDALPSHQPPDGVIAACAATFALCMTWAMLGAGIMVAYLTPTTGLGCYSGTILIYGVVSTVAFLLFLTTSELSWSYCHRMESSGAQSEGNPTNTFSISQTLRVLAVLTRLTAKCLAAISALWEIATVILAYSDVFNSCWCDSVYLSRGPTAYATIFIDSSAISDVSRHTWFGGLFLSLVACILTSILFTYGGERLIIGSRDEDE